MGSMTRAQIVTAGMQRAGRTDIATIANGYLNNRLRTWYSRFQWPFLTRRATAVALAQGSQSLAFGAGSGGETLPVRLILNPMWVYTSDYSQRGKLLVRQLTDGEIWQDETVNNPASNLGLPAIAKVKADKTTWGLWSIVPQPFPDRAYLLAIDYVVQPADIDTSTAGDSTIPLYPNDETMIQAVEADVLRFSRKLQEWQLAEGRLGELMAGDKLSFAIVPGTNDLVGLDPNTFRSGNYNLPWPS